MISWFKSRQEDDMIRGWFWARHRLSGPLGVHPLVKTPRFPSRAFMHGVEKGIEAEFHVDSEKQARLSRAEEAAKKFKMVHGWR